MQNKKNQDKILEKKAKSYLKNNVNSSFKRIKSIYFALKFILCALFVIQAYFLAQLISSILDIASWMPQLNWYLLYLVTLQLLIVVLNYITSQLAFSFGLVNKQKVFTQYNQQLSVLARTKMSENRLVNVLDSVEQSDFLAKYYQKLYINSGVLLILMLFFLVIVATVSITLSILLIGIIACMPFVFIIFGKILVKLNDKHQHNFLALSDYFLDTLRGMISIKLFGRVEAFSKIFEKNIEGYKSSRMALLKKVFLMGFFQDLLVMAIIICTVLVLLNSFFNLFEQKEYSIQNILFVFLIIPELVNQIREYFGQFHLKNKAVSIAKNIISLKEQAEKPTVNGSVLPSKIQSLDCINLCYETKEQKIIKHFNYQFNTDVVYWIKGRSGCGKTTLTNLILGFIQPSSGEIKLNNQTNINEFMPKEWFKKIAVCFSPPSSFEGKVYENICIGELKTKMDELELLAKEFNFEEESSGNLSLNKQIGASNFPLSGGQLQLVNLLRVFLKSQANLIILDEPTANLSATQQQKVVEKIKNLKSQQSILIVVSHDEIFQSIADKIIDFEKINHS